jgi:hypothetical protein
MTTREAAQWAEKPKLAKLIIVVYVGIIGSLALYFVMMGLWLAGLI